MSDTPQREMTLDEWVDRLPETHSARLELHKLRASEDRNRLLSEALRRATLSPHPHDATSRIADPESQIRKAVYEIVTLNTALRQAKVDAQQLKEEVDIAREYNKLRNVKRGTGVLSDWQRRLSNVRAKVDASGALERANGRGP